MAKLTDKEITDALARGEKIGRAEHLQSFGQDTYIRCGGGEMQLLINSGADYAVIDLPDLLANDWEIVKNG